MISFRMMVRRRVETGWNRLSSLALTRPFQHFISPYDNILAECMLFVDDSCWSVVSIRYEMGDCSRCVFYLREDQNSAQAEGLSSSGEIDFLRFRSICETARAYALTAYILNHGQLLFTFCKECLCWVLRSNNDIKLLKTLKVI